MVSISFKIYGLLERACGNRPPHLDITTFATVRNSGTSAKHLVMALQVSFDHAGQALIKRESFAGFGNILVRNIRVPVLNTLTLTVYNQF